MTYSKLDVDMLYIVSNSDAAFDNNADLTSLLGGIVILADADGYVAPISFNSYKPPRVKRSVLVAEVIAFADLFDGAFTFRAQLEQALSRSIPLHVLIDSKYLFKIIGKSLRTSEKRLMLDISATREAYNSEQISHVGFVR